MSDKLKKQAEESKILEINSGSVLYGTNTKDSDTDYLGIFMPSEEYVYGLKSVKEIDFSIADKKEDGKNTTDAVDKKLYEFRNFINLAAGNNPNILEMLFVNTKNIIFADEIGKELLANRYLFPSRLAATKLLGYARSQEHKMIIRSEKYNELLTGYKVLESLDDKTVMAEVYNRGYEIVRDKDSSELLFYKKTKGFHIHCGDICFEPGIYVKKARRMLKDRLDKATNRTDLILKYGYDTKYSCNFIRLLTEGISLMDQGFLVFPLPNMYTIIDIKNGRWPIEEVVKLGDALKKDLERAEKHSFLPATPDYNKIEALTIRLMKQHLRKGMECSSATTSYSMS